MRFILIIVTMIVIAVSICSTTVFSGDNQNNTSPFINVKNVIPEAIIDIRYAGENNFMSIKLDGYNKPYCWLLPKAAFTLKRVSLELKGKGYMLKFFDCYRPIRAMKHMIRWAKKYHPNWLGLYISRRINTKRKLGHSSGNTVDLTLVNIRTKREINMGTDFDSFSKKAWTFNAKGKILKNRMILYSIMKKYGFKNFYSEWWHYTLTSAPAFQRDIVIE